MSVLGTLSPVLIMTLCGAPLASSPRLSNHKVKRVGHVDPDGARAAALQRQMDAAGPGAVITLSGVYNFSVTKTSFMLQGKRHITLRGRGDRADMASRPLFLFGYVKRPNSDNAFPRGPTHPGINISSCHNISIQGAAIDYFPKVRQQSVLFHWLSTFPFSQLLQVVCF